MSLLRVQPSAAPADDDVSADPPALEREAVEVEPTAEHDEAQLEREALAAEDGDCVRRVLEGQREAFERLVQGHSRKAIAVSYRLLGNQDDARDVVQDAFLKAFRSLDTLERPEAFGGWFMRIVTNLSLNFRRGRRLRIAQPLDGAFGEQRGDAKPETPVRGQGSEDFARSHCPEHRARGKELGEQLRQEIAQLPDKQRQALLLFTVEQLPQREVARRLDCSTEAVKWHVFQARKKLRDRLEPVV
ncbi:MAG: RNA polymerase sigma factor [Planctomycetota bacterium]